MIIYLIRHGKTHGNGLGRYIGKTDEDVSQEGVWELEKKDKINVDMAFSSPRKRCLQTAKIMLAKDMQVEICENFAECDFGDFENKNYVELENNQDYKDWVDGGCKGQIPGGESMQSFCDRTLQGLQDCAQKGEKQNAKKIAIFCHGGSIMAVKSQLFGGEFYSHHVGNGEVVEIQKTSHSQGGNGFIQKQENKGTK